MIEIIFRVFSVPYHLERDGYITYSLKCAPDSFIRTISRFDYEDDIRKTRITPLHGEIKARSPGLGEILDISECFTDRLDPGHSVGSILPFAEKIRRNRQRRGLFAPKHERPADATLLMAATAITWGYPRIV